MASSDTSASWQNRIVGHDNVDPEKLLANPKNWRTHPEHQREALKAVLDEVGVVQSVIVNKRTGHLVDGHLRVELAKECGYKTIPVVYVNLTEAEEAEILATLDPLSAMAEVNTERLDAILKEVSVDSGALDAMLSDLASSHGLDFGDPGPGPPEDPGADIDRAEELLKKWGVELGQVWEIPSVTGDGVHRVMCGDSTNQVDVDALMAGSLAQVVFTDPPYNVASHGRNYAATAPTQKKTCAALRDADWDKDFVIGPALSCLLSGMAEDCTAYVCASQFTIGDIWTWMAEWSKFNSYCVWAKPNPAPCLAKRHWTWATELIAYGTRGRHVCNFPEDGHALSWWNIVSPSHTTGHPTQKPVEVPTRAIRMSSADGGIVLDTFLGSGTTVVAAEQLGRTCYGMEIEPKYVAVTLERLAGMGLKPKKAA